MVICSGARAPWLVVLLAGKLIFADAHRDGVVSKLLRGCWRLLAAWPPTIHNQACIFVFRWPIRPPAAAQSQKGACRLDWRRQAVLAAVRSCRGRG